MISQEQIRQAETSEAPPVFSFEELMSVAQAFNKPSVEPKHPNDRYKAIHLMPEKLNRLMPSNRKYHTLVVEIPNVDEPEYVINNFNAMTVAYKQNKYGALSYSVVFKAPNQTPYSKRIGYNMAAIALDKYISVDDSKAEKAEVHFSDDYGYTAILGTIPNEVIKACVADVLPPHVLNSFTVADMKNDFVNSLVERMVIHVINSIMEDKFQPELINL